MRAQLEHHGLIDRIKGGEERNIENNLALLGWRGAEEGQPGGVGLRSFDDGAADGDIAAGYQGQYWNVEFW